MRRSAAAGSPSRRRLPYPRSVVRRAGIVLGLLALGCTSELPPHGEVVLIVDTDLPAPDLAAHLRVDVFSADGTWFESRDLDLPDARDWPVSFGIYEPAEGGGEVIVRLRTYPPGKRRTYRGEQYQPPAEWAPPRVASTVEELCAAPPALALGGTAALRIDRGEFTSPVHGGNCGMVPTRGGAAAATVEIPVPGTYRFAVLRTHSAYTIGDDVYEVPAKLQVRSACADDSSAVACDAVAPPAIGRRPRLDVTLQPGAYTVVVAGTDDSRTPADLVVGAALRDAWPAAWDEEHVPDAALESDPGCVATELAPLRDVPELTPGDEPEPLVTVDRLLRITLPADEVREARVTLRGACLGTMARLSGSCPWQALAIDEAATCTDDPSRLDPLVPMATTPRADVPPAPTEQGTFGMARSCPSAELLPPGVACVPGAVTIFGSEVDHGFTQNPTMPERTVVVSTFLLDTHEVTVARFRDALPSLGLPSGDVVLNDGPVEHTDQFRSSCTMTTAPGARDGHAVNCVSWYAARAFCVAAGGDLPTEVQWEWAAAGAGKQRKSRYPWGDELPRCDGVTYGRYPHPLFDVCLSLGYGPQPIGAPGDVTPGGIFDLGGNVMEHVIDAAGALDSPCRSAAGVVDPRCDEPAAPMRVARGGAWDARANDLFATLRGYYVPAIPFPRVGFRCAYPLP